MGIDILFIIMAAYGFYFGYMYGLIKVVMFMGALFGALVIAMYATPSAAHLIQSTLEVDSALLPFVAFVVTLIGVMLVARIVIKLLEENVKNKQVNQATQSVGGLIMSGIFIFLFSVLVTFFSAAHVIHPEKTRDTSFFYKYIEKIPVHGTDLLRLAMPYMDSFADYMNDAMERLETGQKKPVNPHLDDLKHTYTADTSSTELDSIQLDSMNLNSPGVDSTNEEMEDDTMPEMVIKVQIDTSALNKKKTNSKNSAANNKQGTSTKASGDTKSENTTKTTNPTKGTTKQEPAAKPGTVPKKETTNPKTGGTTKQEPNSGKASTATTKTTAPPKAATAPKTSPESTAKSSGASSAKQGTSPSKTTTPPKSGTSTTKGATAEAKKGTGNASSKTTDNK